MAEPISYFISKFIEEGVDFALARIIETKGSAPRKKGAALLMTFDGNRYGTVGGGLLEAKTEELCREVLEKKEGIVYDFILDEHQTGDNVLEMGCGGDVTVKVDFVDSSNPGNLVEEFKVKSNAYIFGGGHVALALEPVLRHVDFKTVVVDDREEYANEERFPKAEFTKVCDSFDSCFDGIETDDDSYIIIVTRGHKGDLQVLRQALQVPHAYLGMIGSRRKDALLYEQLLSEGVAQEDLDSIYAPIGLNIEAETPEEIAISIVAEMIQVRKAKMDRENKFREIPDIHADKLYGHTDTGTGTFPGISGSGKSPDFHDDYFSDAGFESGVEGESDPPSF